MIGLTTTVPRRPLRPHIPSILGSTHGTSESISKTICPKATTLSPRIRSAANEAILGSRLRRAKEAKGIYKSRAYHGVGICQSLPACTDDFDGARTCPDPPFRQWSVVHRRCRVVVRVPAVTSTCQLGSRAAAQCSLGETRPPVLCRCRMSCMQRIGQQPKVDHCSNLPARPNVGLLSCEKTSHVMPGRWSTARHRKGRLEQTDLTVVCEGIVDHFFHARAGYRSHASKSCRSSSSALGALALQGFNSFA